ASGDRRPAARAGLVAGRRAPAGRGAAGSATARARAALATRWAPRRGADLDLRALHEPRLAVGDDRLAGLHAAGQDRLAALRAGDGHAARVHRLVGLDDEHERALLTGLQRLGRDHEGVVLDGERHGHVHELARPQALVAVGERGLEADGAGGLVDGVVDERHRAALGL